MNSPPFFEPILVVGLVDFHSTTWLLTHGHVMNKLQLPHEVGRERALPEVDTAISSPLPPHNSTTFPFAGIFFAQPGFALQAFFVRGPRISQKKSARPSARCGAPGAEGGGLGQPPAAGDLAGRAAAELAPLLVPSGCQAVAIFCSFRFGVSKVKRAPSKNTHSTLRGCWETCYILAELLWFSA